MTFDDFWKSYPHPKNRGSKSHAEKLFNRLTLFDRGNMLQGLERYKEYVAETEWYNAMQAQRWLNKSAKNWQSWIDAKKGEDADLEQLKRERDEAAARAERRRQIIKERWRDRYERQFGHRPN